MAFFCGGQVLNSESLKKNFADVMTELGEIKVNSFLQVEGFQNVFALGDITNVKPIKNAYYARRIIFPYSFVNFFFSEAQATLVATNIRNLAKNAALKKYAIP